MTDFALPRLRSRRRKIKPPSPWWWWAVFFLLLAAVAATWDILDLLTEPKPHNVLDLAACCCWIAVWWPRVQHLDGRLPFNPRENRIVALGVALSISDLALSMLGA